MSEDLRPYYTILAIPEGASAEVIEVAYRKLQAACCDKDDLSMLAKFAYETLMKHSAGNVTKIWDNSASTADTFKATSSNVEQWLSTQVNHLDGEDEECSSDSDESVEIINELDSDEDGQLHLPNLATVHDLWLSLEEILQGCIKDIKISRKVWNSELCQFTDKEASFRVKVNSGSPIGTRLTFPQEGDQVPGYAVPLDLIFIIKDVPHSIFKRLNQTDIECTVSIKGETIQNSCELKIPTLEPDPICLTIDKEMINEDLVERFSGRGLPFQEEDKTLRGDLVVKFKIEEPVMPPIEAILKLTLEEIYSGCSKKVTIPETSKTIQVQVPPGSIAGNQITVPDENVIFTVQEIPHSIFQRSGFDLEYKAMLTPQEAILGTNLSIPTLENEQIILNVNGGISVDSVERINGRGLLNPESGERGHLLIKFDVIFQQEKPQDRAIEHDLVLSLEQILRGTRKKVKINRKIITPRGDEVFEDKVLAIDIKPGTPTGTRFTFPREGDQNADGTIPADIIFIVREKVHPFFTRNGNDLEFTLKVNRHQLRPGGVLEIPTIDNQLKFISVDQHFDPRHEYCFENFGLPDVERDGKRGNLIVNFDVEAEFKHKNLPIEQDFSISLENVLNGCVKKLKITKKIFDKYGQFETAEEYVAIEIKPGTLEGTKFTLPDLGDVYPDSSPSDIICTARYKPHPLFTVNGPDLEYSVQKVASELRGKEFRLSIPTLEGGYIERSFKNICPENSVVRLGNLGLPIPKEENQLPMERGDLVLRFEIFPDDCKDPPIEHQLPLSLEKIFSGTSKRMKIKRLIVDRFGSEKEEEKIVTIHVLPGTPNGYRYTFPCEGDRCPGKLPADVVFVLTEKEHPLFTRSGDNLIFRAQVTQFEAQTGFHLEVPTLEEGKTHPLTFKKRLDKNVEYIRGLGLPKMYNPKERGDILVKFEVVKEKSDVFKTMMSLFTSKKKATESEKLQCQIPELSKLKIGEDDKAKVDENLNFEIPEAQEMPTKLQTSILSRPLTSLPSSNIIFQYLPLHLEDIATGAFIPTPFIRKTFANDGQTVLHEEEIILPVTVAPGTGVGTTFHFPGSGHSLPGKPPGDIVYVATDAPHHLFQRNGVDLKYTAVIHSNQTVPGTQLEIPTLGQAAPLGMVFNQQIGPDTAIPLAGYGLPFPDDPEKRGNLVVTFQIIDKMDSTDNNHVRPSKVASNRDPSIEYELPLTLQEILRGCIKTKTFNRSIFHADGSESNEQETFTIKINPGVPAGSRFRFPQKGNQFPGRIPADILFKAIDRLDPNYKRVGADIEYTVNISKAQMAKQSNIRVPTLDGDYLKRKVPCLLSSKYTIPGRGLPYPNDHEKRGKLVVNFQLEVHGSLSCLN